MSALIKLFRILFVGGRDDAPINTASGLRLDSRQMVMVRRDCRTAGVSPTPGR